jgi:hypothetical protein
LLWTAVLATVVLGILIVSGLAVLGSASAPASVPRPLVPGAASSAAPVVPARSGLAPMDKLAPHPAINITGGWLQLTGSVMTTNPGGMFLQTMAYDQKDGYVLLFGGDVGGSFPANTWAYQNAKWTQLSPSNSPPGQYGGSMAYDPALNETVFFGGYNSGSGTYYNQTWVFSGGQWTNLNLAHAPTQRWRSNLAYDARDGYLLLFGGTNSAGTALTDTWEFANDSWTELSPTGTIPSNVYRTTMVYDAFDREIILFGGTTTSGSSSSSTFAYVNDSWKDISPAKSPLARVYEYIQYDPAESAVIMYGGQSCSACSAYNDTWAFQNDTWTNITSQVGEAPPSEALSYMEFDPVGNYLLMYGGTNSPQSAYYDTTWTFGLSALVFATATPAPTDIGIASNVSVEVLTGETSLTYTYVGLPPGCTSDDQSWDICAPTAAGTYNVQIYVNDTKGHSALASTELVVNALPHVKSITFTPGPVTAGIVTHISPVVTGGSGIFTYAYPKLPPGCSGYNSSALLCMPKTAGNYTVEAVVTDQVGGIGNGSAVLKVVAKPTPARFESSPPAIDYGETALLYANVSGGVGPFSYYWSSLPTNCAPANISPLPCKPTSIGAALIHIKVSDKFGVSTSGTVNLTVNQPMAFVSSGVSPLSADVGSRITFWTNVSKGTAPYNYSFTVTPVNGGPWGCTFTNSLVATCSPTAPGNYTIHGIVTDTAGAQLSAGYFNVSISPDPAVAALAFSPKTIDLGQTATVFVNTTGGTPSFTFTYSGLPSGCTGEVVQTFSCTPSASGHFLVTATAKDAVGKSATASAYLNVSPTLKVSTFTATPGSVNTGNPATLAVVVASGSGTQPYAYRYSGLPGGCVSSDVASLSCTPTATGSFKVQVTVTDAVGGAVFAVTDFNVTSPSAATGLFGLAPAVGYGVLGAIIIVVLVILAIVALRMRSRTPKPPRKEKSSETPADAEPTTPPAEEGEIYGSGEPPAS